MYQILKKMRLNDAVTLMEISAPQIAQKAQPGQFIIFRFDEYGERIPLTIADYDRESGTVTIIFQLVGKSTKMLDMLGLAIAFMTLSARWAIASHLDGIKRAYVVGGGVGCAIAYPQAKALHELGAQVDVIAGFRSKDIVILENEMRAVCGNLYLTTDDGSYGEKGFVTGKLKALLDIGNVYDIVIAIGPVVMMKFVYKTTEPYGVKTIVSLNPIMIDGTGMCGGGRVT